MYGMGGLCGADDMYQELYGVTLDECRENCLAASVCLGFNFKPGKGTCVRKTGGLDLDACDSPAEGWDMYVICKLKILKVKPQLTVFLQHDILSSIVTKRFGLNQENKRFVGTASMNNVADSDQCLAECEDQADCVAWSGSRGWEQNNCYKFTLVTGVDDDSVYKSGVKSCPSSDNGFEIPCYLKLNDNLLLSTGNIRSKIMFTSPPLLRYWQSVGCWNI